LWFSFNAEPGTMGRLYPADLINYYFPMAELVAGRLLAGQFPLWAPGLCSGTPLFAALQPGVLYPGNWLGLWLPVEEALPLRMFVEISLGSWFAAMFFRSWGASLFAASLGGALFGFGCLFGMTFWPPVVATIVWLPWLLFCVEKLVCRWSFGWWLAFVGGIAVQLFAGFPQFAVYSLYVAVPYSLLRLGENWWNGISSPRVTALRAAGLLVGGVLGAGIAAIQLLPTLELVENSSRSEAVAEEQVHYRHVKATASAVLKKSIDPTPKLIALDGEGAGYLGISALLMAILGAVSGVRSPRVWLFMIIGVLGLLLSDGFRAFDGRLYSLYASLPTGNLFRAPERMRLIWLFGFIALAVRGFDHAGHGLCDLRSTYGRVAAAVGLTLGVVVVSVWGSTRAVGLAVATVILVIAIARTSNRPRIRTVAQIAFFSLVLFDINHATGAYGTLRDFPSEWSRAFHVYGQTVVDEQAFAGLRREAGLARLEFSGDPARLLVAAPFVGAPPIDGSYRISCYGPLLPRQWTELSERLGIPSGAPVLAALDVERHAAVFDLTSVGLILELEAGLTGSSGIAAIGSSAGSGNQNVPRPLHSSQFRASVIRNPDSLPRAYWIERYSVRRDEEIFDEIAGGRLDPRARVFVDRAPGFRSRDGEGGIRSAEILSYAPERVEIQVDAPRDGLLVLTDSHYPGWRARTGETDLPILRANALHRAVHVPAGRHRVTFEYVPSSFRRGGVISAVSLAAAILMASCGAIARRSGLPIRHASISNRAPEL